MLLKKVSTLYLCYEHKSTLIAFGTCVTFTKAALVHTSSYKGQWYGLGVNAKYSNWGTQFSGCALHLQILLLVFGYS